jgi:predicted patatin/cPLA2 family phospholipase
VDPPRDDRIYEYIRAAKAIPIVYGKAVTIDGIAYMDGDFGANLPDLIREAVRLGASDIIAIENNPDKTHGRMPMYFMYVNAWIRRRLGVVRATGRELHEVPYDLPPGVRAVTLMPSRMLFLATLDRSTLHLRKRFNLGYADAAKNRELRTLLV